MQSQRCKVFDTLVSDATHLQMHASPKCFRCDFQRRKAVYEACALHGHRSWLSAGAYRGRWGLGCTVCATFAEAHGARRGSRWSKFAKFDVRPKDGVAARKVIQVHADRMSHRLACGLRRRSPARKEPVPQPLACPAAFPAEQAADSAEAIADLALLKGSAPSPAEWVDAWATLSDRVSLRSAARVFGKQHPDSVGFNNNRSRKRQRRQLQMMAEVVRVRIRKMLAQASSISIALDESKYRKIIRFRADLPVAHSSISLGSHVGASGFSLSGVLGLLDCSKKHASDFEEDHAVSAVKQLDGFLTTFCTPLGRMRGRRGPQPLACDYALKRHIVRTVTCVAADGASKERRAVFLAARDLFPNLLIVIRDPAHAIRIASKALHCDDVFHGVWEELFNKRHALVPDLMNSQKWANLLQAIQEDHVQAVTVGTDPQPLARVIRHLAFAKQRFDSTAGPVGKIALMLLPVATLLAHIASDRRHERQMRDRAVTLLRKLDSKFCIATGVSADWGIVCNWFLRLFDAANHDIAKSRSEIDCMVETLDAVFRDGRVFQRLLHAASGAPAAGVEEGAGAEPLPRIHTEPGVEVGFITGKVMHNLRRRYVFYAGGTPVLLWGDPHADHTGELLSRVQNAASLTRERLMADFPPQDVRSALAIFDRRQVKKAFGSQPDCRLTGTLLRSVRRLASLLGCEETAAVLQYHSALPYMMEQMRPGKPLAGLTNQQAWALTLDDAFWEAACPKKLGAASGALARIVRFYISIEDGECTVERDLGEFRAKQEIHRCGDLQFHDDTLMLSLNGPQTVAEFSGSSGNARQALTPFSRECASLWRETIGQRRGHHNPKATSAAKRARQAMGGTASGAFRGVLSAARLAVASARLRSGRGLKRVRCLHEGGGTPASAHWTEAMRKFHARTRNNIPGCMQTRAKPGGAFFYPAGVNLQPYPGAKLQPLAQARPCSHIAFVAAASGAGEVKDLVVQEGRHRCATADIVILPDYAVLHNMKTLEEDLDTAVCFLYIVARGLPVTTLSRLRAAGGRVKNIPMRHRTYHVAAMQRKIIFHVGAELQEQHRDAYRALRRLAGMPKSSFQLVEREGVAAPASGGCAGASASGGCAVAPASGGSVVCLNTMREVIVWACEARRVENLAGPKVVAVDGLPLAA